MGYIIDIQGRVRRGETVGGHMTFQILPLLRYVVDIGKSSLNPIFKNSMKTVKREAYQSSTIRLFFLDQLLENCKKIITYVIKDDSLLLRNNNFCNKKVRT